jgi:RimJ/RimL family protein N-acetyltransferase
MTSIPFGFETLALRQVVATCHRDNTASRRVMEKISLSRSDALERLWIKGDGWEMLRYVLTREEWQQRAESSARD